MIWKSETALKVLKFNPNAIPAADWAGIISANKFGINATHSSRFVYKIIRFQNKVYELFKVPIYIKISL